MPFPYKLANTTIAPNTIYPQLTGYKFLVLGHGGHGKDTIGDMLENVYGMPSMSSSLFACENVVEPAFTKIGIEYDSYAHCYADRSNHREFWFNSIAHYCRYEADRLAVDLLEEYDVYTGMRSQREFAGCHASRLFDEIFWVDASVRVAKESPKSLELAYNPATMRFINNNYSKALAERCLADHMDAILENLPSTDQGVLPL